MVSYSAMGERGREEALRRTKGQRKVLIERVERREVPREVFKPAVGPFPAHYGPDLSGATETYAVLIGACGHAVQVRRAVGGAQDRVFVDFERKVGRRMTCPHEDCRTPEQPPREPQEGDCTWLVGSTEGERRCRTRAKWDTRLGLVCTRHRDYLLRNGYLDDSGTPLTP